MKTLIKELLYRIRGEYTTERLIKRGMKVGKNFKRLQGVILDPAHCFLISIGDNVTIAPRVHILAHDASTCYSLGYAKIGKVKIGNNVFIGAESIILPNVKIGNNVIIGAGTIVTKSIENNSVVVGNPARYICSYEEYIEKEKNRMKESCIYDESYTFRNKYITEKHKQQIYEELDERIGFIE